MSIEEITEKISPILREYKIKKASIFGSVSRGEDTPESDVDLLVELDKSFKIGIYEFIGLKYTLEDTLGKKVDLLTEDSLSPILKPYILPDLKIIYEN